LFPRLALGLSGFETGVVVMPLIQSKDIDERIKNTKRLLVTAAIIMSVFLMATSIITTLLIPAPYFQQGGIANGRAMAYLAHQYLGAWFGSVYDLSTILILAFAGASALAGLLSIIPRYLPGFGMAPEWARASRPLVLVFVAVAFSVTLLFHANVDAQGGAYATGVLVLITSASCAVTIAARKWFSRFILGFLSLIFIYTTLINIWERPEGLKISCIFIFTIIFMSLVSRAVRSTELRITGVELDDQAKALISDACNHTVRIIAWNPRNSSSKNCDEAGLELRRLHGISPDDFIFFFEVERGDTSDFTDLLRIEGRWEGSSRSCMPGAQRSPIPLPLCSFTSSAQRDASPCIFSLDGRESCDQRDALHLPRRRRYSSFNSRSPPSRGKGPFASSRCPCELAPSISRSPTRYAAAPASFENSPFRPILQGLPSFLLTGDIEGRGNEVNLLGTCCMPARALDSLRRAIVTGFSRRRVRYLRRKCTATAQSPNGKALPERCVQGGWIRASLPSA
jgi:hypothetical protein